MRRNDMQTYLTNLIPERVRVYFQPPASVQLTYPCLIFKRKPSRVSRADNKAYRVNDLYEVTVLTLDVDEPLFDILVTTPKTTHTKTYTRDRVYHHVFDIY